LRSGHCKSELPHPKVCGFEGIALIDKSPLSRAVILKVFFIFPLQSQTLSIPPQQNHKKLLQNFSPGYGCRCPLKIYLSGKIKQLQYNNFRKEQFKEFAKNQFKDIFNKRTYKQIFMH